MFIVYLVYSSSSSIQLVQHDCVLFQFRHQLPLLSCHVSPVYICASVGHVAGMVKLLDAGADVHHKNTKPIRGLHYATPLHSAAREGKLEVVKLLHEKYGAKLDSLDDKVSKTGAE